MGEQNGVTRFYGPYSQWQAGAHMDIGNAYLQKNTMDVEPEEGKLVLFPAYLPHKAMPYEGDQDRIIRTRPFDCS
jgi:ectoine hydroxylase-related dioxygenase (phytanoyl-CoA dioxygenase family)